MKNLWLSYRFLLSRKSHSLVNLVAIVSTVAVLVPTMAMVVVLSLHNGLAGLVHSIYSDFDSELSVRPRAGQYFVADSSLVAGLREFCEVSEVLECNVLLQYNDYSSVAVLRGVDDDFELVSGMPSTVGRGLWRMRHGDHARGVMGSGVSYNLSLSLAGTPSVSVMAVVPPTQLMRALGVPMLNEQELRISGIFSVDMALDSRYVFTDINYVRGLLGDMAGVSSLELAAKEGITDAHARATKLLENASNSSDLQLLTRTQMRQSLYSVVSAEKYIIYMVLIFVLLIAVLSLAGCSLMMTAEKSAAIGVLRTMGMTTAAVRWVFVRLSLLIVGIGLVGGLVLGSSLVLLQQNFGFLKTSVGAFVVDSYPVELLSGDLLLTFVSVGGVGFLVVWLTLRGVNFRRIR